MSNYAKYECLTVEVADKVATVTLNRPQARNAINQKLIRELRTIWDDLADDHAVNVVVLTGAGADGISAFIVEPKTMPGITFGRHERKMGFRGAPNTPIFFDNVRVPAENLVGEEGKGFRASMRALDLNRPTIGAQSVGLAQGALDACIAYAKERKQFKQPIAEFQGVQFMLADMAMQIEAARALVYECARAGDAGDWKRLNVLASMAKCVGSDMAMKVTTDAVQIFGGYGYTMDYPVERRGMKAALPKSSSSWPSLAGPDVRRRCGRRRWPTLRFPDRRATS